MSGKTAPARCSVCGTDGRVVFARFHQVYSQKDEKSVLLDWWECEACRGLFVHPIPSPEIINRHLAAVDYNDPGSVIRIAKGKQNLQRRILNGLSEWTEPGQLLDVGCNYGEFLIGARKEGWTPSGFEPYKMAAEAARAKGFDVRSTWSLSEAGFSEQSFSAITAVDVFCLVWDPISTLRTFHRLLQPGGVLAMRLTNKRLIAGVTRAISPVGHVRDRSVSKVLLDQFHSIGLNSFMSILRGVGFDRIKVQPHAFTAPWSSLPWQTQIAYLGAAAVYRLTLKKINVSPGVLLFARKAIGAIHVSNTSKLDYSECPI